MTRHAAPTGGKREPEPGRGDAGRRQLWELRRWVPSRGAVLGIAVLSLAAGLLEASLLALVAAIAATVAQDQGTTALSLGPIAFGLSTGSALAVGTLATVAMVALRLGASRISSTLLAETLVGIRTRVLGAYLAADYEVQRRLVAAELHDLLVFQSMRMSRAVMLVISTLSGLVTFLALIFVALLVDALTAGLLILVSVALGWLFLPLLKHAKRAGGAHLDAQVQVGVDLGDVPGLIAEAHVYGAADGLLARAGAPLRDAGNAFRASAFVMGATPSLYLGVVFLLLLGGLAAIDVAGGGDLQTLGAIVLLTLRGLRYSQRVQSSLQGAIELSPDIDSITGRVSALEAARARGAGTDLEHIATVVLSGVTYLHAGTDDGIREVSVTLHRGEIVGVVGHSGAGKSTFAEVLLGLRQPGEGRVLINGLDRDQFAQRAWFDRVAYVGQDARLLAGSVQDNVAFFRSVDASELARVLRAASLTTDLDRWQEGANRQVGHGGRDVSGGQRQRIAIARALVGDPDLLVLDEPTSAVDPESEHQIRAAIAGLRGRTLVVVIAHRRSTLDVCDRIVEFADGRLVEVTRDLVQDIVVE